MGLNVCVVATERRVELLANHARDCGGGGGVGILF